MHDVLQRKIESLEFFQGLNFDFVDSLKKNGKKFLLICDDSCEENCHSIVLVDNATAGRHCRWSTDYFKQNFFRHRN